MAVINVGNTSIITVLFPEAGNSERATGGLMRKIVNINNEGEEKINIKMSVGNFLWESLWPRNNCP